ncbi:copper resistance CopC/CopD family protein [Streptomyces sp. NPDC057950]|uniref:copper resistance CopC/CopD family protein n=1 Tax=Streptomyces sp. NPDC057950 TaxID=3346288 RepID=UPI0036E4DFEC
MTVTVSWPRCLAVMAAAFVLLWCAAGPAPAHAALVSSMPAQGAVTANAPARVVLNFSEKVALSPDALRVLRRDGRRVDDGRPTALGGTAYSVRLQGLLPDGTYTVTFHVVSADSHPVSGAFTFSVGAPSTTDTEVLPAAGNTAVDDLYGVARFIAYTGLVLLLGSTGFVLFCWPTGYAQPLVRRLVAAGWLTVVAGTATLLVLRGSYTGSGSWQEAADLSRSWQVLHTKFGLLLWVRLLLLTVLAGVWRMRRALEGRRLRADWPVWAAAAGGLTVTWAAAEHASAGVQVGLAIPVDMLHLVTAGVWLGGLSVLAVLLWRVPAVVEPDTVGRFSRLAFGCVCVLVLTGAYQVWRQVGSLSALDTRYGQLLLIKLGLAAGLLAFAFFSRRFTRRLLATARPTAKAPSALVPLAVGQHDRPPVTAGLPGPKTEEMTWAGSDRDSGTRRGMRWSVAAEACVGLSVLAVTTLLTTSEPARTERAVAAAQARTAAPVSLQLPFDTQGAHGRGTVSVVLDPGRVGGNSVHVSVTSPGGTILDVPEIRVALTSVGRRIGPLPVPLRRAGPGHWTTSGFQVPAAGVWDVAVTVRTSAVDQVTVRKDVRIG